MDWFQHLVGLLRPGGHALSSPSAHVAHMVVALAVYILACRLIMRQLRGTWREVLLAAFNVAGIFGSPIYGRMLYGNGIFIAYLTVICLQYVALYIFCEKKGWLPWLA